jgi:hypothetical protein
MHVGQPRLPRVAVLSDILLVVLTGQTLAAGSPTPDEAVREYLAGIAASDAERILGASAIDEMAEGHRPSRSTLSTSCRSPVTCWRTYRWSPTGSPR